MKTVTIDYEYKKRYDAVTLIEKRTKWGNRLKQGFIKFFLKIRLRKLLDSFDVYEFSKKREPLDTNDLSDAFIDAKPIIPFYYNEIELKEIHFFEALEIDNFDSYRQKLIGKFSSSKGFFHPTAKNFKEQLSKVKTDLDAMSQGPLFSIDYSKQQSTYNDLINFISIHYIKTHESYFILRLIVHPSKKFNDEFHAIVKSNDAALPKSHFKSLWEIARTGRFYSHSTYIPSIKTLSISNLISDLNFQVKKNFTSQINGLFHSKGVTGILPHIEYYEAVDLQELKKDKSFSYFLHGNDFESPFIIKDLPIELNFFVSEKPSANHIKVLKQKGIVKTKSSEKDSSNYSSLEFHFLLESLAFPCVFETILNDHAHILRKIRRDIYDFIRASSNRNIVGRLFFFIRHKKYIDLKLKLAKIQLTLRRFENELTKENMFFYTVNFDLSSFSSTNEYAPTKNLIAKFMSSFSFQLDSLKKKTQDINDAFKTIEEINSYRTNLLLQFISILIAILALIFTFDKAKEYLQQLYRFVFK